MSLGPLQVKWNCFSLFFPFVFSRWWVRRSKGGRKMERGRGAQLLLQLQPTTNPTHSFICSIDSINSTNKFIWFVVWFSFSEIRYFLLLIGCLFYYSIYFDLWDCCLSGWACEGGEPPITPPTTTPINSPINQRQKVVFNWIGELNWFVVCWAEEIKNIL